VALPVSLLIWLLPLFAVMLTSVRGIDDLNRGNFWGWPTEFQLVENYTAVFTTSPMGRFILNSVRAIRF
jgi:multiple sugar transport system permease protein